jgi:hypothetical protein
MNLEISIKNDILIDSKDMIIRSRVIIILQFAAMIEIIFLVTVMVAK